MDRKRILIVDDEAGTRDLLGKYFNKLGFETAVAEDGAQGLNILQSERFDAMIADVIMPKIDGLELATRAKAMLPELVITLITGYASFYSLQQAIRVGVHDYLTKPLNLEELRKSIESGFRKIHEMALAQK
jgi:DNA-binding NtrC family response regulator